MVASLTINVVSLALPIMLLQVYDRIIPNKSWSTLWLLVGGVVIALTLEMLVKRGRSYITAWLSSRFEYKASCAALRRLLDTNITDFEREGASLHNDRFRAIAIVREFYAGEALLALFDLPFLVGYLALIWMIAGTLVAVPFTLFALYILFSLFAGRRVRLDIGHRSVLDQRRFSFLSEVFHGIHSIKTMALESVMQRRYEMLQDANVTQSFRSVCDAMRVADVGSLFSQLTVMGVVAFGASRIIEGAMTPGALAACVMLSTRSLQPVRAVMGVWMRVQGMSVAREQVLKLFETPAAVNAHRPSLPAIEGALTLSNVTLRFPGAASPLFSDLSLHLESGECVAIMGDSGSGKSSLLALMAGMLHPAFGRVEVDNFDLAEFSPSSFARQIAYLPQQGVLFRGTVLENITMFDPSLKTAAVEVARELGLDRVMATMRHGYETWISGNATDTLPAGIRQRIAIARALVHQPRIVLFDEANIAIDSAGDELLRQYLARLKGKCTMVLVTHRPSLLKLADRQYTIEGGTLAPAAPAAPWTPGAATEQEVVPLYERPPPDTGLATSLQSHLAAPTDLSMCLVGLLTAMNWRGSPRQFAESLPHMAEAMDITSFCSVMANLNYSGRSVSCSLQTLDPALLPCLFLPRSGGAKVLLKQEERKFLAFDGITMETLELPVSRRGGTVYVFEERERTPQTNANRGNWVLQIIGRFRSLVWMNFVLTLAIAVLGLATPAFVMTIYNTVIPIGNPGAIPFFALGVGITLVIEWVLRRSRQHNLAHVGARCEFLVGNAIFQRLLALPATFTEQATIGSQLARLRDFELLREAFVGPMALFFYELPITLLYVVALTILNGWLFFVLMVSGLLFMVLGLIGQARLAERVEIASRAGTERHEFLVECLGKMRAIKFTGCENLWYDRFRILSARAMERELAAQRRATGVALTAQAIGSLTGLAALTTCVIVAFNETVGLGAIVVSMMLTWRLTGPLQNSFLALSTAFRLVRSIGQINNLMRLKVERDPNVPPQAPPPFKGEILFSRVSFRYSSDADPALLGITLRVPACQVVAVAGRNGAGKSTLLKLVTGIYQPQAGNIRMDNVDIRQLDPWDLRALISYAPQSCDLFYGTIAQNLRLVHPTATDEELRWAADMAGLTEDIMSLSRGFNTRVADGQSSQMPNGFRQRLSLARTYLKPAPVVLFDEPGNGLDTAADQAFQRCVGWLRQRSTVFIVSHRPSHLKLADIILFLEDGHVRQIGSYDQVSELIMKNQ
jgi:ATP-binding cassette subfamily B protein